MEYSVNHKDNSSDNAPMNRTSDVKIHKRADLKPVWKDPEDRSSIDYEFSAEETLLPALSTE